jgi:3-oxoacyl-[acyl-carrier-protein] synthase I
MSVVYNIADNIVSPLGFTTEANIHAVLEGWSGGKFYPDNTWNIPEAFFASLIDDKQIDSFFWGISAKTSFTRFEKIALISACEAVSSSGIDAASDRTLFVLSSTKGNIGLLEEREQTDYNEEQVHLWHSASVIARFFNNPNQPIVISNACISGVSAQIVAKRMLQTGKYNHVVVIGADVLSKFIISGFQSFKALSHELCKPFDAKRVGLNLGEGAATIIYGIAGTETELPVGAIMLENGAITNDANHISGPSRTGEGLFLALQSILIGLKAYEIGFVNAHGTATPYNDEMESIALQRAGLITVPVNSLKGYYGHTLGATGLIETIISAQALSQNKLIKSMGYEQCGVSNPVNVITKTESKTVSRCIKMVSGFGGCNAAILLKKIS